MGNIAIIPEYIREGFFSSIWGSMFRLITVDGNIGLCERGVETLSCLYTTRVRGSQTTQWNE